MHSSRRKPVSRILCVLFQALSLTAFAEINIETIIHTGSILTTSAMVLPSSTDLVHKMTPEVEGRLKEGKPEIVTDGRLDARAILADKSGGTTTGLIFTLREPSNIKSIRVYSHWGDARAFQNYDIEIQSGNNNRYVQFERNIRVGKPGEIYPIMKDDYVYTCLSTLSDGAGGNLATQVKKIRFTFWCTGHNDYAGKARLYHRGTAQWGTAVAEIDILGTPVTIADADADR